MSDYPQECWGCAGPASEGWADQQAPNDRPLCRDCFERLARQFESYLMMFIGMQILYGTGIGQWMARELAKKRRHT